MRIVLNAIKLYVLYQIIKLNPKESPVKKIEIVEKNVKPTELNTETDPLITEEDCSTDDTVLQELTLILYISHFHL